MRVILVFAVSLMAGCAIQPAPYNPSNQPVRIAPDTLCPACDPDTQVRVYGPGFQPAHP